MNEASPKHSCAVQPGPRHSTIRLPVEAPEGIRTIYEYFLDRFPRIGPEIWERRFRETKVLSRHGPIELSTPYEPGLEVHYYREVDREPPVRRDYQIVFKNDEILVVDKPPHLPVIPGGRWVRNSLLLILEEDLGESGLAPLHRIDRLSSGLLIFSRRPETRSLYSRLFQPTPLLRKEYLVVCELHRRSFSKHLDIEDHIRRSPSAWYRQEIVSGAPINARCEIHLADQDGHLGLYRVRSLRGRKHQLRVQLAHAGLPILGDPLYGSRPRNDPEDLSIRMFLDAHRIEIGDFALLQGRTWESREDPGSFFRQALRVGTESGET